MRIQVSKDENSWVEQIWFWVHSQIGTGQRVFIPAGNTPLAAYRRWTATPSDLLRSLRFVQIDDILNGPQQGTFKKFFAAELKPFLSQFEWIDHADAGADVAILGVGVNGHVAFHEPHLPANFCSGCVALTSETRQYLELPQPTWGITYGAGSFLRCKKILLLARGEVKQRVLRQAQHDQSLPVGWIMRHPDVTLISDFEL